MAAMANSGICEFLRIETQNASKAKSRAKLVDEVGEILLRRARPFDWRKRRLRRVEAFDDGRAKPQHIETITRIESIFAKDGETLIEQRSEARRIAQGPARSGFDMFGDAIDAVE